MFNKGVIMSDPAHPVITFQVNLDIQSDEDFGPNTNLVNPHILNPFRYQNDQDNAVTEQSNLKNTRGIWLPGLLGAENLAGSMGPNGGNLLGHGDQFTLSGKKAMYIKDTYTNGITGDATSWPLYIYSIDG